MSGLPGSPTIDLPSPAAPMVNQDGTPNPIWYRYFQSSTPGNQAQPPLISFLEGIVAAGSLGSSVQQTLAGIEDQLLDLEAERSTALADILAKLDRLIIEPELPVQGTLSSILSVLEQNSKVQVYGSISGGISASQVIFTWICSTPVVFRTGMFGSQAKCNVQATNPSTFSIQQNGVQFATMRWGIAATAATFPVGAKTTFAPGDLLTIVAPNPVDATLEGLVWNLLAKHSQSA